MVMKPQMHQTVSKLLCYFTSLFMVDTIDVEIIIAVIFDVLRWLNLSITKFRGQFMMGLLLCIVKDLEWLLSC